MEDSLEITLKPESCHDANFVVTGDKVGIMTTLGCNM